MAIAAASARPSGSASALQAAKAAVARAFSVSSSICAQRCETAWKEPTGTPNCLRSLTYRDGHVERPLAHAHELGADGDERAVDAGGDVAGKLLGVPAGAHARGRAGGVDRVERREVGVLGCDHDAAGAVVARRARSRPRRRAPITSSAVPSTALPRAPHDSPVASPRQPPLALLGGAGVLDHRGGHRRSAGTAPARASGRAPHRGWTARSSRAPPPPYCSEIAIPGQPNSLSSRHSSLSIGARLGVLAHALGLGALGEQLARGALDLALVVGEAEVHGWLGGEPSAAAGRARARRRCS